MRNDEQIANNWLKQNGIASKQLLKCNLLQQQAQMVATNLITHHANWLNSDEHLLLTAYTKSKANTQTTAQAYKVLNIGKRLNRTLFRKHRQSNTNANKSLRSA